MAGVDDFTKDVAVSGVGLFVRAKVPVRFGKVNVLSVDETYAVCLKDDNRAIGSVGLIPPMQSHTKAAAD